MVRHEQLTTTQYPDLAFVSGAACCGKTSIETVYETAAASLPGNTACLSIDDMRAKLWDNPELRRSAAIDPHSVERKLFEKHIDDEAYPNDALWHQKVLNGPRTNGRSYLSERQRRQSEAVWELAEIPRVIEETLAAPRLGRLLVHGVALLPPYLQEMREKYPQSRQLVVVNTNPDHIETTLEIVREGRKSNDPRWINSKSDAWVRSFMELTVGELSQEWISDCKARNIPYIDMGNGAFADNLTAAAEYLAFGDPLPEPPSS